MVCDKFIYPIFDWESHPWQAVLMVGLGMLVMPIIQAVWWGCYKLRTWVSKRLGKRRGGERWEGENIISYKEHQVVTKY